jgi:hypothetical protein
MSLPNRRNSSRPDRAELDGACLTGLMGLCDRAIHRIVPHATVGLGSPRAQVRVSPALVHSNSCCMVVIRLCGHRGAMAAGRRRRGALTFAL